MAPSRKSRRQLDSLSAQAADLWEDQKDVLDRANRALRDASRYARNEAASRGRDAFEHRVRPAVNERFAAGRGAAHSAREHLVDDVLPVVSSALGSAIAILEAAKNPEVRAALGRATAAGRGAATRAVGARSSRGPARYILIGVGVVAVAGIAYAAWQTLRSDDDLWIDDEEFTEPSGNSQPS